MFVYPQGGGFSGILKLVQPGDELFNECSENSQFSTGSDVTQDSIQIQDSALQCRQEVTFTGCTYNVPLKGDMLEELSHKNFSPETLKKIKCVTKMYREWRIYRHSLGLEHISCDLDKKDTINYDGLIFALTRFITEVKKLDGSEFPPKTLYDSMICVQFHLETLGFGWKLLNDPLFKDVKFMLDNLMEIRTANGIGVSVKQAQFLSETDEQYLWSLGLLGNHTPQALLDTVIFMIGKGFALQAGKEHQQL